jgi:hypothetical protein
VAIAVAEEVSEAGVGILNPADLALLRDEESANDSQEPARCSSQGISPSSPKLLQVRGPTGIFRERCQDAAIHDAG